MGTMVKNKPTAEGRELGSHLERWFDQALERQPHEIRERCQTCAFRNGTLANGSPVTTMEALKCVVEGHQFQCHEKGREGQDCVGWAVMRQVSKGDGKVPWKFADEYEETNKGEI